LRRIDSQLTGYRKVWELQRVAAQFCNNWLSMLAPTYPGTCALYPKPTLLQVKDLQLTRCPLKQNFKRQMSAHTGTDGADVRSTSELDVHSETKLMEQCPLRLKLMGQSTQSDTSDADVRSETNCRGRCPLRLTLVRQMSAQKEPLEEDVCSQRNCRARYPLRVAQVGWMNHTGKSGAGKDLGWLGSY
jgi:hypothetical protein